MVKTTDEFAGWGGLSKGASYVPNIDNVEGYNHNEQAVASFRLNFPNARAECADLTQYPVEQMARCDLHLSAPVCPPFGKASGIPRAFDSKSRNQPRLFEGLGDDRHDSRVQAKQAEYARSRLLMHEPVKYLRHWVGRGQPVLIGILENVPEAREWEEWDAFVGEFHKLGYKTRLVAMRASHVRPVRAPWAPTDRDRLFLCYWHESLGRDPDWDKWLRPNCWCSVCEAWVLGIQTFKERGVDMGSYGEQYLYRCPNHRGKVVPADPETRPALSILDPTVPGRRLSDRRKLLVDNTIMRIANGVSRYWLPLLAPTGGSRRAGKASPAGFVTPGRQIGPAGQSLLPFITRHRGGGDIMRAFPSSRPTSTFSAQGNHHGLGMAPDMNDDELTSWARTLLVPYFGTAETCYPASTRSVGTLTTHDRYGIAHLGDFAAWEHEVGRLPDLTKVPMAQLRKLLDPVRFRMLTRFEARDAMGFDATMTAASKSGKVWMRLIGNSVAVPCGEILTSALVECLTGQSLARDL